jgi:hypothetical protein
VECNADSTLDQIVELTIPLNDERFCLGLPYPEEILNKNVTFDQRVLLS